MLRSAFWKGALALFLMAPSLPAQIGSERGLGSHLADGDEYGLTLRALLEHGQLVFDARWTVEEGGGRPLSKGTGPALADPNDPLLFPRNFNRLSAPDANSCAGCHNQPRSGGAGDFVANVFVLGHRFDFLTLDSVPDGFIGKGTTDETAALPTMQSVANSRNTLGMFGSGYIEMLARRITTDLQAIRDALPVNSSAPLVSLGLDFGTLARDVNGDFDTSAVVGLPWPSLQPGGDGKPDLLVRPFHQAGAVISLRQFTNNAMNHHHGMQSTERFGDDVDPDGDGIQNELTRADITAATLFQAALPVPGRIIPNDKTVEQAVRAGEQAFVDVGCAACHIPELPLTDKGWIFSEPNPFNPAGNLTLADVPAPLEVDLNKRKLERPRLEAEKGVTWVQCFTDFKLHDICSGPADPNREPLDMHRAGTAAMFDGNRLFLTRKLWGIADERPYFHHGQFTTLREAIEAHAGEASAAMVNWLSLATADQDAIIEFLKTLRILPAGTKHRIVDERGRKKKWPAFPYDRDQHLP